MTSTCRGWPRARHLLEDGIAFKRVPVPRLLSRHASHVSVQNENRRVKKNALNLPITPFNDPAQPLDAAINATIVHLARKNDSLSRNVRLRDLLIQAERDNAAKRAKTKYPDLTHVRKIYEEADMIPIVQLVTASELRAESETRHKPVKSGANTEKRLELNWGLDQKGDLMHKLDRLREFLSEGRRVDVTLARKRGSRIVGQDEMESLVAQVRDAALDVPGADEVKAEEGKIGGVMVLHFGSKAPIAAKKDLLPTVNLADKDGEKISKREERRLKEEQRQLKAQQKQTALEQARTVKVADLDR